MEDYDVEWTMPYTDSFTGPGWSDGKFQSSVAFGKKKPKSKTDWLSREHDTGYALCRDYTCLDNFDRMYYDRTRGMSLFPRVQGSLVYYGNKPGRYIERLAGKGRKMNKNNMKYGDLITDYYKNGSGMTVEEYIKSKTGKTPELEEVQRRNIRTGDETGAYNPITYSDTSSGFVYTRGTPNSDLSCPAPTYTYKPVTDSDYIPQLDMSKVKHTDEKYVGSSDSLGPNYLNVPKFMWPTNRRGKMRFGRLNHGKHKNKIYIM